MLGAKKAVALICTSLMLLQGVPGLLINNTASAATTYHPAVQEIMSRQYPILMGNQFSDKEIDSNVVQKIAKDLDMVAINKSSDLFIDNGANSSLANQIKNSNPKVKVLQYINLVDIWDYQPVTFPWMQNNNVFLSDDNGNIIHPYEATYGPHRWAGDPVKTNWQDYYANHLKDISNQGMDGIFSDNWFRTNFQNWNISSDRFSQMQQGWEAIGQKAKAAMNSDEILVGNGPAYSTYQARDISMLEMRNAPNSTAFNDYLKMSDEAASYGQANIDSVHFDFNGSEYMQSYDSILGFSLPACLLTDNIFAFSNRPIIWGLIEKVGKIGYPKGPRYRDDGVWTRDFTLGKVIFNDTQDTTTIQLPQNLYRDLDGNYVSSVTLDSFRGVILKATEEDLNRLPDTPTETTVTGVYKGADTGNYYVNLSWKDNSFNETGFEILQSVNSTTNFQIVSTTSSNTTSATINLGTNPPTGNYYYQVVATNNNGKSTPSTMASGYVNNPVPVTPSNLKVDSVTIGATSGDYYVNLSWKDNSINETGFEVQQSFNSTDNFKVVKTPGANAYKYGINVGKTPGTYYFKIAAVNGTYKSGWSNIVSSQIGSSPTTPSAPTNLAVNITGSGTYTANLNWNDNSNNETGFKVYQSLNSQSNFQEVSTLGANVTSTTLNLGSTYGTYYFKVVAINSAGQSADSNIANDSVSNPPPSAPTNLTVNVTGSGSYTANLNWSDNSNNETGFKVYQALNSQSNFQEVSTLGANATNTTLNLGSTYGTYYFKVVAINSAGQSPDSNIASASITDQKPVAPSNLTFTGVTKGVTSGSFYTNLAWKDNSTNETGFELYQSINSPDNYQLIKTPAANQTSYGINLGTSPVQGTYYYKILAVNSYGKSQLSNVVTGVVNVFPAAPSNLTSGITIGNPGNYLVNLNWNDNSTNETGFKIYQSINSTNNFQEIRTVAANSTSNTIDLGTGPTSGTYYFKIIAVNNDGQSQPSNISSSVLTGSPPAAPSNLASTGVTKGATTGIYYVNLTWQDNSNNETGFELYQAVNTSTNFQLVKSPLSNAQSYGVGLGTNPTKGYYFYKIKSVNSYGKSSDSNTLTVIVR